MGLFGLNGLIPHALLPVLKSEEAMPPPMHNAKPPTTYALRALRACTCAVFVVRTCRESAWGLGATNHKTGAEPGTNSVIATKDLGLGPETRDAAWHLTRSCSAGLLLI
jgi:hypothetical protein